MKEFISFAEQIEKIICRIVDNLELHVKWLNTLSYLENCGARKIAGCEHPILVREEMLKHASEEFRHAHHLKKQIARISSDTPQSYAKNEILGGAATFHYLNALDVQASRYLKGQGLAARHMKEAAYLLVTYAIELRAAELYPVYDRILRETSSPVTVKSILLEEKEHLAEMTAGLKTLPDGVMHAEQICKIEGDLCRKWLQAVIDGQWT